MLTYSKRGSMVWMRPALPIMRSSTSPVSTLETGTWRESSALSPGKVSLSS